MAQIDHLIIDRYLKAFVCESKAFHAGVKITEEGEFVQWNDFRKRYEPIRSPTEQNLRHISVFEEAWNALESVKLPVRCASAILISPPARIIRPRSQSRHLNKRKKRVFVKVGCRAPCCPSMRKHQHS